jgi:enoyl-CoA hydratase
LTERLSLEVDQGIGRLTLNRPEKRNSLAYEDWTRLSILIDEASHDDDLRVLVLRGAGEKAFSTGADLTELAERDPYAAYENALRLQRICGQLAQLRKPSIAMLRGYAVGGGFELALCCTFRVAAENALVGLPEVKMGTLAGAGGTQRVTRMAPRGAALKMLLLGDLVPASEARANGLVDDVVPEAKLEATVQELARRLTEPDARTVALILDAVRLVTENSMNLGLAGEAALFGMTTSYDAFRERINEFKKRA